MRSRSIDFVLVDGKVQTDTNGVAVQSLTVRSTVKDQKVETVVQCPHFRESDIAETDDSNCLAVTLPEGWDSARLLKALNQGTRLLAQQPVHMKYTETGMKTKNRLAVYSFMGQNGDDPDVKALSLAMGKVSDMNALHGLLDKFHEDFIADDE